MREMRGIGGYMTVEVSAVLPVVFMVLWLFLGYLFYFMNCGITQGIIGEIIPKAADAKMSGGDYETGEISYGAVNKKNIASQLLSQQKNADQKAEKEIRQLLSRHLFLGSVRGISVKSSNFKVKVKIETELTIPGADFLSVFGIQMFIYEGVYQTEGTSEIEKIRRWAAIEGTVD